MWKSPDNIYWLFSSSAQSIAAFVGLLASGFIFSHDKLTRSLSQDDSLEEVYSKINADNHKALKKLFILTGFAISLSLLATFTNGFDFCWNWVFQVFVGILNVVTIISAISFVIYVTKPDKVATTVKELIDEEQLDVPQTNKSVSITDFLTEFIKLERLIKQIAERRGLIFSDQTDSPTQLTTLRNSMGLLLRGGITDRDMYNKLRDLNHVRNLAVHGQLENVETKYLDQLKRLIKELEAKLPGINQ